MIGFDCRSLKVEGGGKDACAYNFLMGFHEIGVADQILVFCNNKRMEEKVKGIGQFSTIVIELPKVDKRNKTKLGRMISQIIYAFKKCKSDRYMRSIAKNRKLSLVVFADKGSPHIKFPMKTVGWENDIKAFSAPNLCAERGLKLYLRRREIKLDFKFRDHIIAISHYDEREMNKYFSQYANKISQFYVPIRFFDINREKKEYIVALNIQWSHKNVFTLIKAYCLISERTSLKLLLIGNLPPNYDEIYNFIINKQLKERIVFTGFISDQELSKYIAQAAIYVNPSLFEGFGMTTVEMMGNGIPTIVSGCEPMPEVTLGRSKYYAPATDEKALAETIMEELTFPSSSEELGLTKKLVREKYNYLAIARTFYSFIESIK